MKKLLIFLVLLTATTLVYARGGIEGNSHGQQIDVYFVDYYGRETTLDLNSVKKTFILNGSGHPPILNIGKSGQNGYLTAEYPDKGIPYRVYAYDQNEESYFNFPIHFDGDDGSIGYVSAIIVSKARYSAYDYTIYVEGCSGNGATQWSWMKFTFDDGSTETLSIYDSSTLWHTVDHNGSPYISKVEWNNEDVF